MTQASKTKRTVGAAPPDARQFPESIRRLVSVAHAASCGVTHMTLDEWRSLERELDRELDGSSATNMNTSKLNQHSDLLIASLTALPAYQLGTSETDWFPAVDIIEAGEEYLVEVDLPGLRPEEIEVKLDSGALSISGKRAPFHRGRRSLRVERPSGAFVRRLPLPQDARSGEIRSTFHDGVLELHLPRSRPENRAGQVRAAGGTNPGSYPQT